MRSNLFIFYIIGLFCRQEGVNNGVYRAINLPIKQLNGPILTARVYMLVAQPVGYRDTFDKNSTPFNRQPSKTYLQCLVKGAIESGINVEYINWLKSIKHNGVVVKALESKLDLINIEL